MPIVPPEVERYRRPAFVPHLAEGDGPPAASKLGGRPWLGATDRWPTLDGQPMPFLLQLDLGDLSELAIGSGLLQVFYQPAATAYDDWEPWTPTKHIRIVAADGPPATTAVSIDAPWGAKSIVGFDRIEELPDVETLLRHGVTLSDELDEYLSEYERPRAGFKIGGWPHWIQGPEVPRCPKSGAACRHRLQLDSNDRFVTFGDTGVAYVFQSPAFPDLWTMTWQSC